MNGDEPMRDFKKNRNISGTVPHININSNINHAPTINSPTLTPSNNNGINQSANSSTTASNSSASTNPNILSPPNNKLINNVYVMEGQKSPSTNYTKEFRIG
jgi:hypothetical protein